MESKTTIYIALLLFCALLVTGCAPTSTPESPDSEATLPEKGMTVAVDVPSEVVAEPTETIEPESIPCTIAFQSNRDGNWEIYSMAPDGSNQTNLSNDPADDFEPAFSPDGSQIAFVSNRETDDGVGQYIYVMNADGSDIRRLPTVDGGRHPAWAPTGDVIVYDNDNDIFIVSSDGSEDSRQLIETPERDVRPDFSPENDFIAWISGDDENANILIMDLGSEGINQITPNGGITDAQWTVDAEIFFHGKNELFGCFNCVMSADGTNIRDAGGKGSIQEFLPFWTLEGDRVECVHADGFGENDDIYLVSDIYPDIFYNLTDNPASDRNPSWPDNCGPATEDTQQSSPSTESAEFIIGYEDADGVMTPNQRTDLDQACSELPIVCVQDDFEALIEQHVDAIISFSSRWHVMGSSPQIFGAVGNEIPVIVLNAETDAFGAYNLSNDSSSIQETLSWMFKEMGGTGELTYFVFGQNAIHQSAVEAVLSENPGITATQLPAEYDDNSVSWENIDALIKANPGLGAIWSDENVQQLLIAVRGIMEGQPPYINCELKDDFIGLWQEAMDTNPLFKCVATVNPGGTAYEGIYFAYYLLSGHQVNPEALTGPYGNTLYYDYPVVTNETLEAFLGSLDEFRMGDWGIYELAPMTPEKILDNWFIE